MQQQFRNAEAILLDVALRTGVSVDLIRGRHRTRTIARARALAAARLRHETDLSWREIGMVLGKLGRYDSRRKQADLST